MLIKDQGFDEDEADKKISDMLPHEEAAKENFLAYMFLNNADNARFGGLKDTLSEDFNKKKSSYPETVIAAYELLDMTKAAQVANKMSHLCRMTEIFRIGRRKFNVLIAGNMDITRTSASRCREILST